MNRYIKYYSFAAFFTLALLFSCEEDYEQVTITFYPTLASEAEEPAQGTAGTPVIVKLRASRVLAVDSKVNVRIQGNGAGYGNSYVTNPPQLEPGIVTLNIPRGEVETSFTFTPKNDNVFIPTNYQYSFIVEASSDDIKSVGQGTYAMAVKDNTKGFITEDFTECPNVVFEQRVVSGPSTWSCSGFGNPDEAIANRCYEANAYGKGSAAGSNAYMVLKEAIDGKAYSTLYISTAVYSRFTGNGGISFKYSTTYSGEGNPEAEGVEWKPFDELNSGIPAAGTQKWTNVAAFIKEIPDTTFYIAVHHAGGTTASSSSWRIDDFSIKGN